LKILSKFEERRLAEMSRKLSTSFNLIRIVEKKNRRFNRIIG